MKFIRSRSTAALCVASLLLLCLIALAACGGGIGGSGETTPPPNETGTVRVSITDAPACGYDEVNVSITKVRIHQDADALEADDGWSEVVLPAPMRVDLLTLRNGVLAELGQTTLPTGNYNQMRLVLAPNTSAEPFANSVIPTGGVETALSTPSGAQSGIKINVDVDVAPDQIADVVLDFDACKSVVRRGASGLFNLKPVISATVLLSDAGMRVEGYVDPSIAFSSTSVSLQVAGVPIKSTAPDSTGRFVLYPVPVGTYDLVVTSANRVTAVMTGVPVITTAFTTVNSASLPIAPPAATVRPVSGSVTPATATVRALQPLTLGPTIEASSAPVDGTSGAFTFTLPIEAPVRTLYVPNPVSLGFVADATAAGRYTLEANNDGSLLTQSIDVSAPVPNVSFVFP
jgi:hypothetical protein